MLVLPDGEHIGCISGGCLEADVRSQARQVAVTGEPRLVTYDSRRNFDVSLELGCGGSISILIERVESENPPAYLGYLSVCFQERRRGVLGTVFGAEGECIDLLGQRVAIEMEGGIVLGSANEQLNAAVACETPSVLRTGRPHVKSFSFIDGSVDVLLEPIVPPVSLLLCGAGQDAPPLAQFASLLGWEVTVIDQRSDSLTPERFPDANLITAAPERLHDFICLDTRTAAVVMTHNYALDLKFLQTLLPNVLPYVGLLGAKHRRERLLCELQEDGFQTGGTLGRLYAPVGLDIGAEAPEAVACSVIAEIQAVMAGRLGGSLRHRNAPIHGGAGSIFQSGN